MHLVGGRDLAEITVADVAERAGINRSTFYSHYRDVDELAEAACTAVIDALVESLPPLGPGQADPGRQRQSQQLVSFFTHLADYENLYRSLLGPQGSARVIDHIRRRITTAIHIAVRFSATGDAASIPACSAADDPHDTPAAFAAGALIGVGTDWLHRRCPRTPTEMAALTWPLLSAIPYLDGADGEHDDPEVAGSV